MTNISNIFNRVLRRINYHKTTETYFVSYPKTGNTWLRFMLGRYLQKMYIIDKMPLFDETDYLGRNLKRWIGPTIGFTHKPLTWNKQIASDLTCNNVVLPFKNKKVILIARHPLDALVSHYFQVTCKSTNLFHGDIADFIEHPVFGLSKYLRFYALWMQYHTVTKGFHLCKYEMLKSDTVKVFMDLLVFLQINIDDRLVVDAVNYSSFENMKMMENNTHNKLIFNSSGLYVFGPGDRANPNAYFVRRGKVGGYKDYLSSDTICRYEEKIEREMPILLRY